ncbi:MAG: TolB family protein [Gaiellaceae bacterium]
MGGPERPRAMRTLMLVSLLALAGVLALTATAGGSVQGLNGKTGAAPGDVAYAGNGTIYLIKANGTEQRVLVSGGSRFRIDEWGGIGWSRDGGQIAFTVGNHRAGELYGDTLKLYVAAGDGTKVRPLSGAPSGSFYPTWSPDGSQIAFSIRGQDGPASRSSVWTAAVFGSS